MSNCVYQWTIFRNPWKCRRLAAGRFWPPIGYRLVAQMRSNGNGSPIAHRLAPPVGAANRWAIGDPLPLGQSNAPLVLQRVLWVVQPHPAADVSHRHHRRVSLASECRRVLYKSSVTAYKRRMTVRYVVLQVISHSIQTSYDGKLCCSTVISHSIRTSRDGKLCRSTVISHSIRTSRDGKVCCSIGHQSQHTNVAWR